MDLRQPGAQRLSRRRGSLGAAQPSLSAAPHPRHGATDPERAGPERRAGLSDRGQRAASASIALRCIVLLAADSLGRLFGSRRQCDHPRDMNIMAKAAFRKRTSMTHRFRFTGILSATLVDDGCDLQRGGNVKLRSRACTNSGSGSTWGWRDRIAQPALGPRGCGIQSCRRLLVCINDYYCAGDTVTTMENTASALLPSGGGPSLPFARRS
jgi:hypothetical protein